MCITQGLGSDACLSAVNSCVQNFSVVCFPVFVELRKILKLLIVNAGCSYSLVCLKEILIQSFKDALSQDCFVGGLCPVIWQCYTILAYETGNELYEGHGFPP